MNIFSIYNNIVKKYIGVNFDGEKIIIIKKIGGDEYKVQIDTNNVSASCSQINHSKKINKIINDLNYLDNVSAVSEAVDIFFDWAKENNDESGFDSDEDLSDYDIDNDTFWLYLRSKCDTSRSITIHTYGNKFKQFAHWNSQMQCSYNALVINSKKPKNVDLRHARGTDIGVQKAVRAGREFETVMTRIVESVESNNYNKIGIYCRAGHHRSVAVGELLKKYVYKNATVNHITISR